MEWTGSPISVCQPVAITYIVTPTPDASRHVGNGVERQPGSVDNGLAARPALSSARRVTAWRGVWLDIASALARAAVYAFQFPERSSCPQSPISDPLAATPSRSRSVPWALRLRRIAWIRGRPCRRHRAGL